MKLDGPALERFLDKVETAGQTGCWRWLGSHFANGYAAFWFQGQNRLASRVSYENFVGPVGELDVLHHCDNPDCVRPDHLYRGTHSNNMHDREVRGRANHPKGETHSRAKLTQGQVLTARSLRQSGASYASLARMYGVTLGTVRLAVLGINWKHIAQEADVRN